MLLCCVSLRSAAPDLHKLNEDGELWLVNQGLKETIRCCPLSSMRLWPLHREGERCSFTRSRFHQPFLLLRGDQLGLELLPPSRTSNIFPGNNTVVFPTFFKAGAWWIQESMKTGLCPETKLSRIVWKPGCFSVHVSQN